MDSERRDRPGPEEYEALLEVWESSVRATHTFLSEADITDLRPRVREAFDAVSLRAARDASGRILGFSGIAGDVLEMLFARADARGQGIGAALLRRALDEGVTRLDVNEQNPQALGFYVRMGFEVVGRSAWDGQGRPFPLLHMRLKERDKAGAIPRGYAIQAAGPEHVPFLNAIELAAAAIFPPGSIPEHVLSDRAPAAVLTDAAIDGRLMVALDAAGRPVGYGLLRFIDDLALLSQMDVYPDHGRKGLGRALVMRIADIARRRGADFLHLTTFVRVPWNAPFYTRLGFMEIPEPEQPPAIRDILADERSRGLINRTAMRLALRY